MTKFEVAIEELRDAYDYAASLCDDPPDVEFEDLAAMLEEAGGYGIGLEEESTDPAKALEETE